MKPFQQQLVELVRLGEERSLAAQKQSDALKSMERSKTKLFVAADTFADTICKYLGFDLELLERICIRMEGYVQRHKYGKEAESDA